MTPSPSRRRGHNKPFRFLLGTMVLAFGASLVARPAPARGDAPSRERVRQLLSAYEGVPGSDTWKQLGPQTLGVLVELYNDGSQPPYVRLRAVGAAAHYPSPATRTFLLGVARTPDQKDLFVRQAVLALGRAFDERAVDAIRPFLEEERPVVREAAARALGRIGNAEARRALHRRMADERHEAVRDAIRNELAGRTR